MLSISLSDADHGYLENRLEGSAEILDSRASDPREFVMARDIPISLEQSIIRLHEHSGLSDVLKDALLPTASKFLYFNYNNKQK